MDVAARSRAGDLPALTGLRAFAATAVLALHVDQAFAGLDLGWFGRPVELGYFGVDLFFLLSGFVLTHVYGARFAQVRARTYAVFLGYRFARLYPVHIAVLAALVAGIALAEARGIAPNNPESWRHGDLVWHALLVHAWGVTDSATWNVPSWSISSEWLAYLTFPLWAALAARCGGQVRTAVAGCVVLAALAALVEIFDWRLKTAWVGWPAAARVLCEFALGCVLHRLWATLKPGAWGDGLAALALAGFVALPVGGYEVARVACLALVLLGCAAAAGPVHRLLAAPATVFLGEVSYAVYMIHFALVLVVIRVHEAAGIGVMARSVQVGLYLGVIALARGMAALVTIGYERPARRFLRGLVDRWGSAPSDRPA
jgi:peptidoglycan/LPS O-acetylase OafA/YrhL